MVWVLLLWLVLCSVSIQQSTYYMNRDTFSDSDAKVKETKGQKTNKYNHKYFSSRSMAFIE